MRVKLNRGPMKNKRVVAPDDSYRYLVRVPDYEKMRVPLQYDPYDVSVPDIYREGEYHKSYTRLKDGTVVFEWMGWKDGQP